LPWVFGRNLAPPYQPSSLFSAYFRVPLTYFRVPLAYFSLLSFSVLRSWASFSVRGKFWNAFPQPAVAVALFRFAGPRISRRFSGFASTRSGASRTLSVGLLSVPAPVSVWALALTCRTSL